MPFSTSSRDPVSTVDPADPAERIPEATLEAVAALSRAEIETLKNAGIRPPFPEDTWRQCAEAGLLRLSLPRDRGGPGWEPPSLAALLEQLAAWGTDPGFCFSLMFHWAATRTVFSFYGADRQPDHRVLSPLETGKATVAVGISEPHVGSHPRKWETTAVQRGGLYVLNGRKAIVTNGPIADLFVITAVTADCGERNRCSAFLVPRGTAGFSLTEPLELSALQSSPHCAVELSDCRVPETHVVGVKGRAHETLARGLREIEDVYLSGLMSGLFLRLLTLMRRLLRETVPSREPPVLETLGRLNSLVQVQRLLAREAASRCSPEATRLETARLLTAFRSVVDLALAECAALAFPDPDRRGPPPSKTREIERLQRDIGFLQRIAGNALRARERKLGAAFLESEDLP